MTLEVVGSNPGEVRFKKKKYGGRDIRVWVWDQAHSDQYNLYRGRSLVQNLVGSIFFSFFLFKGEYLGFGYGLSQFRFNLYQAIRMTRWEVAGLNQGCVRINFFKGRYLGMGLSPFRSDNYLAVMMTM